MHLRPLAIPTVAVAALLTAAIWTAPAPAATYDVVSCSNQTGGGLKGDDNAWQRVPDPAPAYLRFARGCPPLLENPLGGLLVQDQSAPAQPPMTGAFGEYRFDAPAGTTVSRLQLSRQIGKRSAAWELYTSADGVKLTNSDCTPAPTCQIGVLGDPPADWPGLRAGSLSVGIRCAAAPCPTGGAPQAWTAIYGAVVTVDDPTPPTVSVSGALLTNPYVGGTVPAGISSATDASGIQRFEVRVDGVAVGAPKLRLCDFTRRVPCSNITTSESVSVATAGMTEAEHTVELRVVDAAGNVAATSRTVTVDNTAPAAPTPTTPTSLAANAPTTVGWTNPDGQLAPITTAHIELCGPVGCTQQTQAAAGNATLAFHQGDGRYVASVWLEDAAGNHDPANRATWTVDFAAPPAGAPPAGAPAAGVPAAAVPPPVPGQEVLGRADRRPRLVSPRLVLARPTVARDRRTIAVRGSVAAGVTGTVTVTASARIRGRTRTVTRRAAIRRGRYGVNLRLPSARWRTAKVTVRFPRSATRTAAQVTRTVRQRSR